MKRPDSKPVLARSIRLESGKPPRVSEKVPGHHPSEIVSEEAIERVTHKKLEKNVQFGGRLDVKMHKTDRRNMSHCDLGSTCLCSC